MPGSPSHHLAVSGSVLADVFELDRVCAHLGSGHGVVGLKSSGDRAIGEGGGDRGSGHSPKRRPRSKISALHGDPEVDNRLRQSIDEGAGVTFSQDG